MQITLTFDPNNETDIENIASILENCGVIKVIRKHREDNVNGLSISALCDGSCWPSIDYKIADILENSGITTIMGFLRHDAKRDAEKIKGISDIQMERIRAAINHKKRI